VCEFPQQRRPSQSRRPSAGLSNCSLIAARSSAAWTSSSQAASCCWRNASNNSCSLAGVPRLRLLALQSIGWSLRSSRKPLQCRISLGSLATICAVLAIHSASPTDVRPNFITCNRGLIFTLSLWIRFWIFYGQPSQSLEKKRRVDSFVRAPNMTG